LNAAPQLTALVLAGSRAGGDPLAVYAGVSHKALIPIDGKTMLERVVSAVVAVPTVCRVLVATEHPDFVVALPDLGKPVVAMRARSGPSASVAAALSEVGTPLLVTTADHALLRTQWLEEFLAAADTADAVLALARREAVLNVAPDSVRTWLRFADGVYSGCNLFLLRTPAALGVVNLWQDMEAARKRPLSLLRRLGWSHVLRYKLGILTLGAALGRLGTLSGSSLHAVALRDGRAAIDVDKPADLELVRRLVAANAGKKE
jgi:GTP:adenosylcobinamide-phosphate guanylyltransferase